VSYSDLLPADLGDGVTLHATTAADAAEAYAAIEASRERLAEWLPWVAGTTSLAVEREFLEQLIVPATLDGTGLHTTIRCDGEFGGFAGLRVFAVRSAAEVGYWLADPAVGRGVMLRTVAHLVDLCFGPLELHRFELLAATGNVRSRAVADRLGMVFEGVRREGEELARGYVDLAMYALLRAEWPGSAAILRQAAGLRNLQ
jgi:ribosomal-protein-serine acetyltransferase